MKEMLLLVLGEGSGCSSLGMTSCCCARAGELECLGSVAVGSPDDASDIGHKCH